eukprot:5815421-Prymnesium_polylepis.1
MGVEAGAPAEMQVHETCVQKGDPGSHCLLLYGAAFAADGPCVHRRLTFRFSIRARPTSTECAPCLPAAACFHLHGTWVAWQASSSSRSRSAASSRRQHRTAVRHLLRCCQAALRECDAVCRCGSGRRRSGLHVGDQPAHPPRCQVRAADHCIGPAARRRREGARRHSEASRRHKPGVWVGRTGSGLHGRRAGEPP